jgi:hypothetical protein
LKGSYSELLIRSSSMPLIRFQKGCDSRTLSWTA